MNQYTRLNQQLNAEILAAMPGTSVSIPSIVNSNYEVVRKILARMKINGLAHISAWVQMSSGRQVAIYTAGIGVSVAKPAWNMDLKNKSDGSIRQKKLRELAKIQKDKEAAELDDALSMMGFCRRDYLQSAFFGANGMVSA